MKTADGKPFVLGNRLEINGHIIETSEQTHEIDVITHIESHELPEPIYCIARKGSPSFTDLRRFTQPECGHELR